ncbi:putative alpha-L-fucosidase 1 [Cryptomeria japonica]|uniref:putative alpha-L-fucosidase 1 n=1 Tax=Cryptomeria japonica TaxID=3369 RepID=UPI0027DA19BF|nr:putative alpha-L-fucosidase 1 [Cryptomeria japonica]
MKGVVLAVPPLGQCEVGFCSLNVPPPLPVLPVPSASQLKWQQREMVMFMHFGVNTFTNNEWGTGKEDPKLFNPKGLDANQWATVAKEAGFSLLVLTAKHHDGFCLWPSAYTNHSVKSSLWENGGGDVLKDLSEATRAQGLDLGVYLSPWDRFEPFYGKEVQYNEFYLGQLQELLTKYGPVSEVWFDGAKGDNTTMTYLFSEWFAIVKELQIYANIFSDVGPGVRWVGNEDGEAGLTCWSTINSSSYHIGQAGTEGYLNTGDPYGTDWIPPECDVSIRTGWFWHSDQKPKSLSQLLDIYYTSVGRNCLLLLNIPPNTTGLLSGEDVERVMEFGKAIKTIFSVDLAASASVTASSVRGPAFSPSNVLSNDLWTYWAPKDLGSNEKSHWIELKVEEAVEFNVVRIQESIGLGQRVMEYGVYASGGDEKKMMLVSNGTTIGYKKLHRLEKPVKAITVSLFIWKFKGDVPLISSFGLHFDPFYNAVSP